MIVQHGSQSFIVLLSRNDETSAVGGTMDEKNREGVTPTALRFSQYLFEPKAALLAPNGRALSALRID